MASIELHLSIYPEVYCVVMEETGLPVGELVESVWSTKTLAEARAFQMGPQWTVATTPVKMELT